MFHGQLEQLLLCIVRNHKAGEPVPKELVQFIGCDLSGTPCRHSGKPMYHCSVSDIRVDIHEELKEFVKHGLWSAPCSFHSNCGSWLFFRQVEFDWNASMEEQWKKAGWVKRGRSRPHQYFECPQCRAWS